MSYGTVAGVAAYVKRLANSAGTFTDGTASSLTTALAGANNDLLYTARQIAADADNITIAYVNPGVLATLVVTVTGRAISVALAHDGVAITSTAAQVAAAVAAKPAADALVGAENAAGNDGTGLVTAMGATALSGGVSATAPTLTEVSRFLDQCSDTLNGWLATAGYAIPVVAVAATDVLARYAEVGAAGHAELSQRAGGSNADDENMRENKFLSLFKEAKAYIESGALGALGAAVVSSNLPGPLSGLRVGGQTSTGQALRPIFKRRSFGNDPAAESPSGREPGYTGDA
jgi:hypothetical protein